MDCWLAQRDHVCFGIVAIAMAQSAPGPLARCRVEQSAAGERPLARALQIGDGEAGLDGAVFAMAAGIA
jgi:hypothetical protein